MPPPLKRQRTTYSTESLTSQDDIDHSSVVRGPGNSAALKTPQKATTQSLSHVLPSALPFPRSAYEGFEAPLPPCSERHALQDLAEAGHKVLKSDNAHSDYTYFTLDDFTIYMPPKSWYAEHEGWNADELVALDRLQNRPGFDTFLFDGILSCADTRRYIRGVTFSKLAVDGYGDPDIVSLAGKISIQSSTNSGKDVWYQLGRPAPEYERFHRPFLWLANFTALFVDYLLETEHVTLGHFRSHFHDWLLDRHKFDAQVQSWRAECGHLQDFRTTVTANVGFLWKECDAIDDDESGLCKAPIWGEVDPKQLKSIARQLPREEQTVVTPLVYDLFKGMYFGTHLRSRDISNDTVAAQVLERKRRLDLTPISGRDDGMHTPVSVSTGLDYLHFRVDVGDVITTAPDSDGAWKGQSTTWYAYVQAVRHLRTRTVLDVLWMYEPKDTTIGTALYPYKNELFMSDNCDCGKYAIDLSCVTGKVGVSWFTKDPKAVDGFFVRQTFRTSEEEDHHDFVTLKHDDFRCRCADPTTEFETCRLQYFIGDTVLVRLREEEIHDQLLEPAQIIDFNLESECAVLRGMRRKAEHDSSARPNELQMTESILSVSAAQIYRKCHVRSFTTVEAERGVPLPYSRSGAGDFFFIVDDHHDAAIASGCSLQDAIDLDKQSPPPLAPGPDFDDPPPHRKLNGMGIFCGGGNFDRGLEEGGAVEFKYAVDYDERAINSYRANVPDPSTVQYYYGSVNDYLAEVMGGSQKQVIAPIGRIEVLAAGSPCPGFSRMQRNKNSEASQRNASLVTSFLSFVDLYSPLYALLENVVSITNDLGPRKDEKVFSQILATLVALGYQVQQFLMDSASYGSAQSRPRVFVAALAPQVTPLCQPPETHAHAEYKSTRKNALGRLSNGKSFSAKRDVWTPFRHVSTAAKTSDLPNVGDSQVQLCPSHPDHRAAFETNYERRQIMAAIPMRPYGMGLVATAQAGLLSGHPLEHYCKRRLKQSDLTLTNSFSRINPGHLLRTLTTMPSVHCGRSGRLLHWSQDRALTVLEMRRGQGFLDHEVILGTIGQQVKIIGNSVDRSVAFALGLALRESWMGADSQLSPLKMGGASEPSTYGLLTPTSEDIGVVVETEQNLVMLGTDDGLDEEIAVAMRPPLGKMREADTDVRVRHVRRAQYVLVDRWKESTSAMREEGMGS